MINNEFHFHPSPTPCIFSALKTNNSITCEIDDFVENSSSQACVHIHNTSITRTRYYVRVSYATMPGMIQQLLTLELYAKTAEALVGTVRNRRKGVCCFPHFFVTISTKQMSHTHTHITTYIHTWWMTISEKSCSSWAPWPSSCFSSDDLCSPPISWLSEL